MPTHTTSGRARDHIDWSAQPLGVMPDRTIARGLGVHEETVERARLRRGIGRVLTRRTAVDLPKPVYDWMRRQYPDMAPNDAAIHLLTRLAIDAGVKCGAKR